MCIAAGSSDGESSTELLLCLEVVDEAVGWAGPSWAAGERRGRGWASFQPKTEKRVFLTYSLFYFYNS
jgi:hypothetical protein